MSDALKRLLVSAKFWTVIVGLLFTFGATLVAKYGLNSSAEAQQQIAATVAALFGILIHAQGQADQGKEAAKIAGPAVSNVAVMEVKRPGESPTPGGSS